jgi:hypothetical protein
LQDAICQLYLLGLQTINAGMWQAIQYHKPDHINVQALKHVILTIGMAASNFLGLRRYHRGHAYLAKGISYCVLGHLLVRSTRLQDPLARDTEHDAVTPLAVPPPFEAILLDGPDDPRQVSCASMAFACAYKYFYLASHMLDGQYSAYALRMSELIITKNPFRKCHFDATTASISAQMNPPAATIVWHGDRLEQRKWAKLAHILPAMRSRPLAWRSKVVPEILLWDPNSMGLDIDLNVVEQVCEAF